jgi:uncharacterized OsmC-like protein
MTSSDLKNLQAPLKKKYRLDPQSALVTLKARGNIGGSVSCKVETGNALVEAGLHPATGGDGALICSGDMLLEALVACAGVTLTAVATAIGVELGNGTVEAEGDLDFRGTLGVSKEAPVGFTAIRLNFRFYSDASSEQLESLSRLTERYCVVIRPLCGGQELKHHTSKQGERCIPTKTESEFQLTLSLEQKSKVTLCKKAPSELSALFCF